jgi:penicillin-binding protein 2
MMTDVLLQKLNSIRCVALWLLGLLLAACARASTPAPTPVPPAPTSTATPAPTPTPPPSPDGVAQAYLSSWQAGDYAAMYALLASESQAALSRDDFEKQYRDNLTILSAVAITPTVTSVSESADGAQVRAHLTYATLLIGTLETDVTLTLERSPSGAWGVVYSPALIWPELVDGKQLYMVPFIPGRGAIYDRDGQPMAQVADVYAVGWVPSEVAPEAIDTVITGLSRLSGLSVDALNAQYQFAVPGQYIPLTEALAQEIDRRYGYLRGLSGVYLYPYTSRYYYGNGDAAHVTGYLSFIQPDEVDAYRARGYSGSERVGRAGLEKWGEAILAGRNGGQLTLLDASGAPLRAITSGQPTPAQDIYTTLDFDFQQDVRFALGDLIGAAVVLKRDTGEVLALASNPTFDPNWFDINNYNSLALGQLFSDQRQPLINRAAQSSYPAGSVFKVVTMSAGMTSGLFTPDAEYTCTGTWEELGPSAILNDWREGGHGALTLTEGLSASCNPWFWHVGYALFNFNPSWLSETARALGLGQATGIAQIDETPGQIPDPDWKLRNKGTAWEPLDSLNLAIGQGDVLVTPLQIARLMAAIGNGGALLQPQLVLGIQPPEGEPTFEFQPIVAGQLPLEPEQLAALQEGMYHVTQEPIGTARNRFRGLRIRVGGKTGTAEDPGYYGTQEPHSWFAGYTFAERADRPDIAIAVVVANAGQGSDVAAPIFRRIVESYFGLQLTRYPWESAVGVVRTPEPTPTEGGPGEAETPAPLP